MLLLLGVGSCAWLLDGGPEEPPSAAVERDEDDACVTAGGPCELRIDWGGGCVVIGPTLEGTWEGSVGREPLPPPPPPPPPICVENGG